MSAPGGIMNTAEPIELLETLTLDLPPSSIEFCLAYPNYFLVGTYNLQKESEESGAGVDTQDDTTAKAPQSRNGSLILFRLINGKLELVQTLSTPSAIFELHFHPFPPLWSRFGAVSSTGTFITGRVDPEADPARPIQDITTSRIRGIGEDVLFTSFTWHPSTSNVAAITTSTGHVRLMALDPTTFEIRGSQELPLTSMLETWCVSIVSLPQTREHMIFSGSDDSVLRYTTFSILPVPEVGSEPLPSIKSGDTEEATGPPIWEGQFAGSQAMIADVLASQRLVKNEHMAGVTAILPLPHVRHDAALVVTGSYDEHIRLFLVPHPASALRIISELSLGGGVWKLNLMRFLSHGPGQLTAEVLASCMHGGPQIIKIEVAGEKAEMSVLHALGDHELNYASHFWIRRTGGTNIVTTSFYDKKLRLWDRKT
ncbi:uncharacterized protein DNG_04014 [Cephalotrichum gorgonifer]|uniref:WD40 domain-containing protein n=1 Tax=Cephalotrichum gorgonifer TaxID=2041049 RepID=A0AAE8MVS6_9PEZI|nr:uncharacterized protein DNG_04014 [Cephalotrichum gorgonifer]